MKLQKKAVWKLIKKNRKVKRCIHQNKKEVNEQFRRKMNQDVGGNRKLFLKKVDKVKEER